MYIIMFVFTYTCSQKHNNFHTIAADPTNTFQTQVRFLIFYKLLCFWLHVHVDTHIIIYIVLLT